MIATTPGSLSNVILPAPTCAALLLNANTAEKNIYWDRSNYNCVEDQIRALARSSTVYVGNLAFSTRSIHLRRFFEQLGPVANIHLGLHKTQMTPCGFAFVEFHHRIDALSAITNLTGTKLDGRVIRVELDAGFKSGRQFGRGSNGGQVRDDRGGGSGRDRRSGEQVQQPQNKLNWVGPGGGSDRAVSRSGEKRSREESMENRFVPANKIRR